MTVIGRDMLANPGQFFDLRAAQRAAPGPDLKPAADRGLGRSARGSQPGARRPIQRAAADRLIVGLTGTGFDARAGLSTAVLMLVLLPLDPNAT